MVGGAAKWRIHVLAAFALSFAMSVSPTSATEHECDRLAAAPTDVNKQGPGVPVEELDAEAAIAACEDAAREFPAVDRFKFQLARALNKAGQFQEAARYYEPLANGGYVAAAHNLSVLYMQGAGVSKDSARALDLLRKSAAAGFAFSQYQLGLFYSQGAVVARDLTAAASWFRKAAEQGLPAAENELAAMYQNGRGMERDNQKAVELYRKAADQGFALAQANLGWMYAHGQGVERNSAEAASWYRVAAEKGNAWAQNELGSMYRDGIGVERDDVKAFNLYQMAADQGLAIAQANLGWSYLNGRGVMRDNANAERLFHVAALAENGFAMFQLGWMHELGAGVKLDNLKAYIWYRLAADAGDDKALIALGRISQNILLLNTTKEFGSDEMGQIESDPLLIQNSDMVKEAIHRTEEQIRHEAASWFDKAIQRGSTEAILLLANLHLKYSISPKQGKQILLFEAPSSSAERFDASPSKAVELYKLAIQRGSNAARVNLARLYQLGYGVEKSREKAVALYDELTGTVFAAPAQIGLLHDSLEGLWEAEQTRWRRLPPDHAPDAASGGSKIVVKSLRDLVYIIVTDPIGRRVFSGLLREGQDYSPPRDRNDLILWLPHSSLAKDQIQIRVGSEKIKAPDQIVGVRLNHKLLLAGRAFDPKFYEDRFRPPRLPPEVRRKARIVLESIRNANIYVHSPDDVIGFEENHPIGDRFTIPDIHDLTLELRPNPNPDDNSPLSIVVDGKHVLDLEVGGDCMAVVRLSPDELLKELPRKPLRKCTSWGDDASSRQSTEQHVNLVIRFSHAPNERIPGVIEGHLRINTGIALLKLKLSGQLDELLRAQRIVVAQNMREYGPYSSETIASELDLCETEADFGLTTSARARIDTIINRTNEITSLQSALRINIYTRFSIILKKLGRFAEAERFMLLAISLNERVNPPDQRPVEAHYFGRFQTMAELSERNGQVERALAYTLSDILLDNIATPERSEDFNSEYAAGKLISLIRLLNLTRRSEIARNLLPFVHHEAKREVARDLPEPLKFPLDLRWAEQTFGPVDRSGTIAGALANLGWAYSSMGRHGEALPLFEQQARTRTNIFGDISPQASESLAVVADEHRLSGDISTALRLARMAYAAAAEYVDSRGTSEKTADSTARALGPPGAAALEALYAQSRADAAGAPALVQEAFEVAQRLQASAAATALQAFGARLSLADPKLGDFVRRRQDLGEELTRLDASLVAAVSGNGPQNIAQQDEIKLKIKDAEARLRELNHHRPQKLQETDDLGRRMRAVPYAELREALRPDEALVTVFSGEESSFVFAATRDKLTWARAGLGDYAIERIAATLRCGLDRQQWIGHDRFERCKELAQAEPRAGMLPFHLDVAHQLYSALVGPIKETIAGKQLTLVLSGALTGLPPHVLVAAPAAVPVPKTMDGYRAVAWLGRDHAIAVLPSVTSLVSLRRFGGRERAPERYIGLGDPALSGNPGCEKTIVPSSCPRTSTQVALNNHRSGLMPYEGTREAFRAGFANVAAVRQICPLPDTALELACVARSVGSSPKNLILGSAFTVDAVKRARLDRYRVIHFATHGLLAGQTERFLSGTAEPALVLTPPAAPSAANSGLLTASEIAELKLNADWVVLSACNTASGESPGAEALSGLARAFFYAGARTLLVSHWEVVSSVAVLLTTHMFDEIARDAAVGPAESLRRSMAALMNQTQTPEFVHPQYWAAFVVIGEGDPIDAKPFTKSR